MHFSLVFIYYTSQLIIFFLTWRSYHVLGNKNPPYFNCTNGNAVSLYKLCLAKFCLPSHVDITDFCQNVLQDRFRCRQNISIPHNLVCDGISNCQTDRSDEDPDICSYRVCPKNHRYCPNYGCADVLRKCRQNTNDRFILASDYGEFIDYSNRSEKSFECGQSSLNAIPLIRNGLVAKKEEWPWHVSLYNNVDKSKRTVFCGATLVSAKTLLTAGHCVWKKSPDSLIAAFGKGFAAFDIIESSSQVRNISNIIQHPLYQDAAGNYASDIAILILNEIVEFTDHVRPVCIEWKFKDFLNEENLPLVGYVVGLGLTEDDTFSEQLRSTKMSIISNTDCLRTQHFDFKRYIAITSFCAGWANGTGVCNGDSGGGLVIQNNGRWYIEGIVSVSPKRPNSFICDSRFFALFTKVGMYTDWIKRTMIDEGEKSSFFVSQ